MRVLLDTSAYSQYTRGNKKVNDVIRRSDDVFFSAIVIGELYIGFTAGSVRHRNIEALNDFMMALNAKVLQIDYDTGRMYAEIYDALKIQGSPIPSNDMWIAATAMQYGARLVTFDAHFKSVRQIAVELIEKS